MMILNCNLAKLDYGDDTVIISMIVTGKPKS